MTSGRVDLAHAGANCAIDRFLEGNAEFPRALFQQSREIIVERQGRPHLAIIYRQVAVDLGRLPPDLISPTCRC